MLKSGRNMWINILLIALIGTALVVSSCGFDFSVHKTLQVNNKTHKHLLLLLVPGLSFQDIQEVTSNLQPSTQQSLRLGGMTLRTVSGINRSHQMITLSTGYKEHAVKGWNAFQRGERYEGQPVENLYQQWGGIQSDATILHPHIFKLQQQWPETLSTQPGWLGETIERENIRTFAFGNSDRGEKKQRIAPIFIMNSQGEANGVIDHRALTHNVIFPTGEHTDWPAMASAVKQHMQESSSSLTVIELGDLERLQTMKGMMESEYHDRVRKEWFEQLGSWLNQIQENIHIPFDVWILSPYVSTEAHQKSQDLTPMIQWSEGQSAGLLTSQTTKQEGLISNVDFFPSLLSYYGIEPPVDVVGHPIQTRSSDMLQVDNQGQLVLDEWQEQIDYLFLIYEKRRPVITMYIVCVLLLLIASTLYWWLFREGYGKRIVQILIVAILLSPIYFLWLTPLIQFTGDRVWITSLFVLSIFTSMVFHHLFSHVFILSFVGWANAIVIVYDLVQKSEWMKRSFLGYDPIIGARYYGIGNEYAGILLGSSILGVSASYVWLKRNHIFQGKRRKRNHMICWLLSCAWYVLITYFVASPAYGTNAGAMIASVVTYSIAQLVLLQRKIKIRDVAILLLVAVGGFVVLSILHLNGEHTHISKVLLWLGAGEYQPIIDIITRKWELNVRLIRVSLWGKLFATSLLILVLLLFNWKKEIQSNVKRNPWYNNLRVIIIGASILLLVNDSGIVAAATTMIFATFPFLYLRLMNQNMEDATLTL